MYVCVYICVCVYIYIYIYSNQPVCYLQSGRQSATFYSQPSVLSVHCKDTDRDVLVPIYRRLVCCISEILNPEMATVFPIGRIRHPILPPREIERLPTSLCGKLAVTCRSKQKTNNIILHNDKRRFFQEKRKKRIRRHLCMKHRTIKWQ